MAISASEPSAINTAASLITNEANKYQSTDMAVQAVNGLTSLGATFADLFTGAQQTAENQGLQKTPSMVSQDESINVMQENLFSSLGLNFLSDGTGQNTLGLLTGQSSIEAIQASVLSALQTSLFSAKPAQSSTVNSNSENSAINTYDTEVAAGLSKRNFAQFSFGEDGLDLKDGFDMFNVLQHIPIVSNVYQDVSGEDISGISKLAGGYIYGGMFGLAFSALDLVIESYSGRSVSDSLMSFDYTSIFSDENVDKVPLAADNSKAQYFSLAEQIATKVSQ